MVTESDIPLRELKKARSKIALYESFLSLMEDGTFRDVMLDDICRKAEVSRVTFFNYFQRKEDLLVYFMRVWLTERIIEIGAGRMRGFAAVRHLLQQVARQSERQPGIMPSLISYLAEMNMHPCMPELSEAEIRLLFPGNETVGAEAPDMRKLLEACMREAKADGELRKEYTVDSAVQALFTVFYGGFLTARLYGTNHVADVYESHLQWLIQK